MLNNSISFLLPLLFALCSSVASCSEIDDIFRHYQEKLPKPRTLNERNGMTLLCLRHSYGTYTLLDSCAAGIPIENDNDLAKIVPWVRHDDPCIRQIALKCLAKRIGYDSGALVVPAMHDPEHWLFYDIIISMKKYLDSKEMQYDEKLFDKLLMKPDAAEFASEMQGTWTQQIDTAQFNFMETLEIKDGEVQVLRQETHKDPSWPDHTWATKIKSVAVNERLQYTISGEWDIESTVAGFQGKRIEPSQFAYTIWRVKSDVIWLKKNEHDAWTQFKRAAPENRHRK